MPSYISRFSLADVVSAIFHPLLLPSYTLAAALWLMPSMAAQFPFSGEMKWRLLTFVFLLTFVLPVVIILILWAWGNIKALSLHDLSDRPVPFFLTTLLYAAATSFFVYDPSLRQLGVLLSVMLGAITICLAIVTLVSLIWQISAHSTGVGGIMGFWLAWGYRYGGEVWQALAITALISGVVMSARLHKQAHDSAQIIAGFGLGLLVCSVAVWWFVY